MLNHQKIELNLHEVKIDEIKSKFQLIDKVISLFCVNLFIILYFLYKLKNYKGKTGFLKKSKILEIFCETFPNFNRFLISIDKFSKFINKFDLLNKKRKVLEEFIDIELQADNSESLDNFDVDKLVSLCQKWYQSCYLSLNTLNSNVNIFKISKIR